MLTEQARYWHGPLLALTLLGASFTPAPARTRMAALTRLHQKLCATAHEKISPTQLSNDLHRLRNSIAFMLDVCKHHDHLQEMFVWFISTIVNAEYLWPTEQARTTCQDTLSRFVLELARTLQTEADNNKIRHHLGVIYGYYTRIPASKRESLSPPEKQDPLLKWLGVGVVAGTGILVLGSALYIALSKSKAAPPQTATSVSTATPPAPQLNTFDRRSMHSEPWSPCVVVPKLKQPPHTAEIPLALPSPPRLKRRKGIDRLNQSDRANDDTALLFSPEGNEKKDLRQTKSFIQKK